MTPREAAIIDAHDRGESAEQIAPRLGLQLSYVKHIVATLGPMDDGFERRHRDSMRRGSDALLPAIKRATA